MIFPGYPYYCCPGTPAQNAAYKLRFGPQTTYHFRIVARDLAGNPVTTGDFTFATEPLDVTPPFFGKVVFSQLTDTSVQVRRNLSLVANSR